MEQKKSTENKIDYKKWLFKRLPWIVIIILCVTSFRFDFETKPPKKVVKEVKVNGTVSKIEFERQPAKLHIEKINPLAPVVEQVVEQVAAPVKKAVAKVKKHKPNKHAITTGLDFNGNITVDYSKKFFRFLNFVQIDLGLGVSISRFSGNYENDKRNVEIVPITPRLVLTIRF